MLEYPDVTFTLDSKSQNKMKFTKRICALLSTFLVLASLTFLFFSEVYTSVEQRVVYGYFFLIILASTIPICIFLIIKTYNCSKCNNKLEKVKKEFIFENEHHTHKFQICMACKKFIYDGYK